MSSDYEFSDDEEYNEYDDDEEPMDVDSGIPCSSSISCPWLLIFHLMAGSASSEEDLGMNEVDDDDIKVVSEGKKTYEVDYKPLTHQQVKDLMVADIEYISTIFGVDVS